MAKNDGLGFAAVKTEGLLLPRELLARVAALDAKLPGTRPEDYHLPPGERINETINRSWNHLSGVWKRFSQEVAGQPTGDAATGSTRDRWLLPLFQELGYGRLQREKAVEIEGRAYPISHRWQNTPIHLIGVGLDLDRRAPGQAGAAQASPHGLVQAYLNRADGHLWAFVSNGLKLRILRDNQSLTRQAFVEFDLAALMDGELYADFRLLWLLCHQSRVESERPEQCWLEKWTQEAQQQGVRALDELQRGVTEAIGELGSGFLAHPANVELQTRLSSGTLSAQDYYRQLLRLVYRLIFLFVAEDRDVLLLPAAADQAKQRYRDYYSTARLRRLAGRLKGSRHTDLYASLKLVMGKLHHDGCQPLALPALGSFLWSPEALPDLAAAHIDNRCFLAALRALAYTRKNYRLRPVDYRNLGSEELGSVYESLLELHPELHRETATFLLKTAAGHERKTTGSYYTPDSLVQCLLDSALEPVIAEAAKGKSGEAAAEALLKLKICDPAVGSGHFLIAAAHRLAKHVAAVRTDEEEPSPAATRTALREVIGHCLYGVDINPMSAELCKISLWLEAMEPGKPLAFLDHHIKCGNSLLGATPEAIEKGIPDEAYKPITGDSKEAANWMKKLNQDAKKGQGNLFDLFDAEPWERLGNLPAAMAKLEDWADDTPAALEAKEAYYRQIVEGVGYDYARLLHDAWCAAFVWPKEKIEPGTDLTTRHLREIEANPHSLSPWRKEKIKALAAEYKFFHWHLEFPTVFGAETSGGSNPIKPNGHRSGVDNSSFRQGLPESSHREVNLPAENYLRSNAVATGKLPSMALDSGIPAGMTSSSGFDCVLGNPPWERVKLQEKEFFAERNQDIANAPSAAIRKRLIAQLKQENPSLMAEFQLASRQADGETRLLRDSGLYPLCGKGDINLYSVFSEQIYSHIKPHGRAGFIVPSGIATDDSTKDFFSKLVCSHRLVSIFDFENRENLFPGIGHGRMRFSLITLGSANLASFAFQLWNTGNLEEPNRKFQLTEEEILLINPNTRTCPLFRTRHEAEIVKSIYHAVPVLVRERQSYNNLWQVELQSMFHMTNDSDLFRTSIELMADGFRACGNTYTKFDSSKMLPLYEAKMACHYDHRFGTFEGRHEDRESTALDTPSIEQHDNPYFAVLPRYWIDESKIPDNAWMLTFRSISHATNDRSFIAQIIPKCAVGNSLIYVETKFRELEPLLYANFCSFIFDFVVRQKMGGLNLNFFIVKQLPVFPPTSYAVACSWCIDIELNNWLLPRVLELTYTAWDLEPFAQDCGFNGPPFRWDEERRFLLRCELDAAFFHLYGIERDDVDYIMETFPIVKRKDEAKHGEYRTKRVILEIYDAMRQAMDTGEPYPTRLDPPPADPRCCHPPRQPE